MKQKTGENAGAVWKALNGKKKGLTGKELRAAANLKEKEMYLALGWLLREDKVVVEAVEKDILVKLA